MAGEEIGLMECGERGLGEGKLGSRCSCPPVRPPSGSQGQGWLGADPRASGGQAI